MKQRIVVVGISAALVCGWVTSASSETISQVYRIDHPDFGEVGTFKNVIRHRGDLTIVDSTTDISVDIASVVVYRQVAERQEIWCKGRLISYESVTDDDGKNLTVRGRATGEGFRIEGTKFNYDTSEGIFPTNPWTKKILNAERIVAPTDGELYEVSTRLEDEEELDLGTQTVEARRYEVTGDVDLRVWFDMNDKLVKFTYPSNYDDITFTLEEEETRPEAEAFDVASCPAGDVPRVADRKNLRPIAPAELTPPQKLFEAPAEATTGAGEAEQ